MNLKLPNRTGCIDVKVNQTEYIIDPYGKVFLSECATRIKDVNTIITLREIIEKDLLKIKEIVEWMGEEVKVKTILDIMHCRSCPAKWDCNVDTTKPFTPECEEVKDEHFKGVHL